MFKNRGTGGEITLMRKIWIDALCALAQQDNRIMLLTGDLGYMLVDPFVRQFPERFINAGVAEQNMIGIATGLAQAGFIPYVYSITPFAVLRPYEFIRNGPIYHQLPVRIVGGGSGFDYSHDGISHYALDDVGVLHVQPGISIFVPADAQQAAALFQQTWNLPGPVYYRLGKDEKTLIPGLDGRFALDRVETIGAGKDVLVLSMGSITSQAALAVEQLRGRGTDCTLAVVSSLQPASTRQLQEILAEFKTVITVEEHYIRGGLGSLVAETAAEAGLDCRVTRCGVRIPPDGRSGSYPNMLARSGLSAAALAQAIAAAHAQQK